MQIKTSVSKTFLSLPNVTARGCLSGSREGGLRRQARRKGPSPYSHTLSHSTAFKCLLLGLLVGRASSVPALAAARNSGFCIAWHLPQSMRSAQGDAVAWGRARWPSAVTMRLPCQVVEKLVYVDTPVEKVLLPCSARALVRCSHGMSRPSPRAGIRRLACGCSGYCPERGSRGCRSRRVRDYQVVEKVVEKVIYVDRPLEKVRSWTR